MIIEFGHYEIRYESINLILFIFDFCSKGQITYSNIFCALCNGEILENVKPFWGDVSCNNLDIIDTCGISIKEHILQAPYYIAGSLRYNHK